MNDHVTALDELRRLLVESASSTALLAGAEQAHGIVRAIDDEIAAGPQREADVLAGMAPVPVRHGQLPRRAKSIADTVTALTTLELEERSRDGLRKMGAWLLAQLEARAKEAAKTEAARDEGRKPFADQAKRARDYAQRVGEAPKLFDQVRMQLKADIVIAQVGKGAWSRVPRRTEQSRASAVEINFDNIVERVIATPQALASVRLPGFSPREFSELEPVRHYEYDDRNIFGEAIAKALGELRDLIKNHDDRRIVLSDEGVARAVHRVQAVLITEYAKTCAAIRALLDLDAKITAADCAARYPDGALIFDPQMFSEHWQIGRMNSSPNGFPHVALPSINGMAMAA